MNINDEGIHADDNMTRVGFMRTTRRIVDSAKEAEAMGFEVMAAPYATIVKADDREYAKITDALSAGKPVCFLTSTAVEMCLDHFKKDFSSTFSGQQVYAAASAAECLRRQGIEATAGENSDGVLVGAEGELPDGPVELRAAVYRSAEAGIGSPMLHMMIAIKRGELDWLALTSPSAARSLFAFMDKKYGVDDSRAYLDEHVKIAAMDKRTADALEELGRKPDLVSGEPTFKGLLQAISDQDRFS